MATVLTVDKKISEIDTYTKNLKLELLRLEGMRIVYQGFKDAGITTIDCPRPYTNLDEMENSAIYNIKSPTELVLERITS